MICGTGWIASPDDPTPSLTLRWAKRQTISSLTLVSTRYSPRPRPTASSSLAGRRQRRPSRLDGAVSFRAAHHDRRHCSTVELGRPGAELRPRGDAVIRLGIGVSEVASTASHRPPASPTDTRWLGCHAVPGRSCCRRVSHPTSVSATVAELRELRPVTIKVCDVARPRRSAPVRTACARRVLPLDRLDGHLRQRSSPVPSTRLRRTCSAGTAQPALSQSAYAGTRRCWCPREHQCGLDATLGGRRSPRSPSTGGSRATCSRPGRRSTVHLSYSPDYVLPNRLCCRPARSRCCYWSARRFGHAGTARSILATAGPGASACAWPRSPCIAARRGDRCRDVGRRPGASPGGRRRRPVGAGASSVPAAVRGRLLPGCGHGACDASLGRRRLRGGTGRRC